jgi:hypothetical protein
MRSWFKQLLVLFFICVVTLALCEVVFRTLLFSDSRIVEKFKKPELYFNYFTDDGFWVLNFLFGGPSGKPPTRNIHPLLGWTHRYDANTYRHFDILEVGKRRPVLMYGDSFGMCVTKKCFQHYFNEDPELSKKCYFLNYSTGAHGIDQMYLLFQKSVEHFEKPVVIYSLMTQDLDRAALSVFIGQKPYYEIEDGQLRLKGVPLDPDPEHFFRNKRLNVVSYLYRLLSRKLKQVDGFTADPEQIPRIQALSKLILKEAIVELRRNKTDFFFLIFIPNWGDSYFFQRDEDDWRLMTILSVLKEENVPYIVTKQFIEERITSQNLKTEDLYFSEKDSHPSDLQNEIVFQAMKSRLGMCR